MNTEPIHVLLIEDDMACAGMIGALLKREPGREFTTHHAVSLRDAEAYLRTSPVDAILIDLNLPDSKGILTVKCLLAEGIRAPIVVLSGLDSQDLVIEALRAGAQDYILKGGDLRIVVRAVRHAVERTRTETRRLQAERNLIAAQRRQFEADKLEAVCTFAGSIAQELKNPLAVLKLGIEELRRLSSSQDPAAARALEMMSTVMQHASSTVQRLLVQTASTTTTGNKTAVAQSEAPPAQESATPLRRSLSAAAGKTAAPETEPEATLPAAGFFTTLSKDWKTPARWFPILGKT